MKVLLINGSPKANGNTAAALREMEQVFAEEGIEFERLHIGNRAIRGCVACGRCYELGRCVFDDDPVNEAAKKLMACDGVVIGSPVYYAAAAGTLVSFLNRLFYSTGDKTMKVGAAVCAARRGGLTAAFDQLNKYFTISGMPVASGQYWNGIHGCMPGEAAGDAEGLQMMRTLARNMVFLMRAIADAKEKYGLPEREEPIGTNFIR